MGLALHILARITGQKTRSIAPNPHLDSRRAMNNIGVADDCLTGLDLCSCNYINNSEALGMAFARCAPARNPPPAWHVHAWR
jgi:hypothetical protein